MLASTCKAFEAWAVALMHSTWHRSSHRTCYRPWHNPWRQLWTSETKVGRHTPRYDIRRSIAIRTTSLQREIQNSEFIFRNLNSEFWILNSEFPNVCSQMQKHRSEIRNQNFRFLNKKSENLKHIVCICVFGWVWSLTRCTCVVLRALALCMCVFAFVCVRER